MNNPFSFVLVQKLENYHCSQSEVNGLLYIYTYSIYKRFAYIIVYMMESLVVFCCRAIIACTVV